MVLDKYKCVVFSVATAGLFLVGLLLFLLDGTPQKVNAAPNILFVKPSGGSTECSQANPCDLQTALARANDGDTIYIASGTYTGTGGVVITVTRSITLYGGWDGSTTGPVVRDPDAYPTTLDGEGVRRGVYVGDGITVTLEGFTVTNGIAPIKGAGLYARNARLTLRGMTFYSNVISTTVTGRPYGGGATVEEGTLQVYTSTFRANSVWANVFPSGGGLAISYTLAATVENSLFQDNDAWAASGLYFRSSGTPLTIRGCRFVDNGRGNSPGPASGGYYGAMEIIAANARLEDNLIEHNEFGNGRGAVAVFSSDLLMARNIISGNTAHYDASGLYLSASPFTLTNNIFADNQSTYYWRKHPTVHIQGSAGQMLHNTIVRNDNTYGILVEDGTTVTLTNTILVSHTVGISVTAGSTATMEATLWGSGAWANGADWGGDGTIVTGTINIWDNPAFVNPDSGDYHIGLTSAAIDAGVDAGVTEDIDGDPRPIGTQYDIGGDEFVVIEDYLPLILRVYRPPCDLYEPNDDRYTNPWGPLVSGQSYQAKLCSEDEEDNYYFDATASGNAMLYLQLPSSLVKHTSIWLYAQSNLSTPICGTGPVNTGEYSTQCTLPQAGRYIVRLYTDGASDDINDYILRVTFP